MQLSDSVESSSTESSSSSSQSSSSSIATRIPPTLSRRSPTSTRRASLYSAARTHSPSPILNRHSSTSSSTALSSAPTTLPNSNNNSEHIMSDNNEDLAEFSRSQVENSNPWFLTPTKRKRINSLSPNMLDSYLQILDSGAGISGVGQQWKMTDISQASDVTMQGAF